MVAEAREARCRKRRATALPVLLVEDQPDLARAFQLVLQALGCEVHLAHEGREALDLWRRERPPLVLLDYGLPDLSGDLVGEAIRRESDDVLLVAITGYGHDEVRRRLEDAGFDRHYLKPIDPAVLRGLLDEARRRAEGGA